MPAPWLADQRERINRRPNLRQAVGRCARNGTAGRRIHLTERLLRKLSSALGGDDKEYL